MGSGLSAPAIYKSSSYFTCAVSDIQKFSRCQIPKALDLCKLNHSIGGLEILLKYLTIALQCVFFWELCTGDRFRGRPRKQYKNTLNVSLKRCEIEPESWEHVAQDRATLGGALSSTVSPNMNINSYTRKSSAEGAKKEMLRNIIEKSTYFF